MTTATIPNRPLGSDVRSIEAILADFDAITAVINGQLDGSNIASRYGALLAAPGVSTCTIKTSYNWQGTIGAGARLFPFTIPGSIAFPSTCVACWLAGVQIFTTPTYSGAYEISPGNASIQVIPTSNTVQVMVSNFYGATIYPYLAIVAAGY